MHYCIFLNWYFILSEQTYEINHQIENRENNHNTHTEQKPLSSLGNNMFCPRILPYIKQLFFN